MRKLLYPRKIVLAKILDFFQVWEGKEQILREITRAKTSLLNKYSIKSRPLHLRTEKTNSKSNPLPPGWKEEEKKNLTFPLSKAEGEGAAGVLCFNSKTG